jgi:DNA-binding transcriptional ArsR family regulator
MKDNRELPLAGPEGVDVWPASATAPRAVMVRLEDWQVVDALMALAHETRLAVFRLLVHAGPEGLSAGAISARLGVAPSTLSHHLALLERANLLASRRLRRQIFYACAYDGMRGLMDFLTNDCCRGHPDLCGFTASTADMGCAPKKKQRRIKSAK